MYGIYFLVSLSSFLVLDTLLNAFQIQGVYYFVHAFHNALVVYSTYGEVISTFTDFDNVGNSPSNYYAAELVFALHMYHCIRYWRKFRMDDWLHHILMVVVALPIGITVPSGKLLGFSLFFTTGLPGGIDYFLLFLTRNGLLRRELEKKVNTFLSTWVRAPGCVAQAALTFAYSGMHNSVVVQNSLYIFLAYLTAFLNYWNGMYFGAQVIYDAGMRQIV